MTTTRNDQSTTESVKGRVLVVEDNNDQLNNIVKALTEWGYDARQAKTGQTAVEVANTMVTDSEPLDLVLMDIGLEDGPEAGYQACRTFKQTLALQNIPVIFLTGARDEGSIVRGFEVGGIDFIAKPPKLQELKARVDTHVRLAKLDLWQEQLVGCLVHDLNNPLSAIKMFISILQDPLQSSTFLSNVAERIVPWE